MLWSFRCWGATLGRENSIITRSKLTYQSNWAHWSSTQTRFLSRLGVTITKYSINGPVYSLQCLSKWSSTLKNDSQAHFKVMIALQSKGGQMSFFRLSGYYDMTWICGFWSCNNIYIHLVAEQFLALLSAWCGLHCMCKDKYVSHTQRNYSIQIDHIYIDIYYFCRYRSELFTCPNVFISVSIQETRHFCIIRLRVTRSKLNSADGKDFRAKFPLVVGTDK